MAAMADMAGSRQQLLEQDVHIGLRLERIVVAKLLAWQCVLLVSGNANAWLGAALPTPPPRFTWYAEPSGARRVVVVHCIQLSLAGVDALV